MKYFLLVYSLITSICLFYLILVMLGQLNEIDDLHDKEDRAVRYITDYRLREDKKCDNLTNEELELIEIIRGEDKE